MDISSVQKFKIHELIVRQYACQLEKMPEGQDRQKLLEEGIGFSNYDGNPERKPMAESYQEAAKDYLGNWATKDFKFYLTQYAYGDFGRLCPDVLPASCLEARSRFSDFADQTTEDECQNSCDLVQKIKADPSVLSQLADDSRYKSDPGFSGMIWRFAGEKAAHDFCERFSGDSYDFCLKTVNRLVIRNQSCEGAKDDLVRILRKLKFHF